MLRGHLPSALFIIPFICGAILAIGNRTVVEINQLLWPEIADGSSNDLSDLSLFVYEHLNYNNPHPGLGPTSCSETSSQTLDQDAIIIFQFRCSNNQAGSYLIVDLSKANNESLDQVLYKYKKNVVAIDITASAPICTSVELANLKDLLRESWDAVLILSVSVDGNPCLVTVLEELANNFQAPNLQTVSIEYLDSTDKLHVKALTSLVDSIRQSSHIIPLKNEVENHESPKEETKYPINKQPNEEAVDAIGEPREQILEEERVPFADPLTDRNGVLRTCPDRIWEHLGIEPPYSRPEARTPKLDSRNTWPDVPKLPVVSEAMFSPCSKTSTTTVHGISVQNFHCKLDTSQTSELLQIDLNGANEEILSRVLHKYQENAVAVHVTGNNCTQQALDNLALLFNESWKQLEVLRLSINSTTCLPIVFEEITKTAKVPSLEVMSIGFVDATLRSHVHAVKAAFDTLQPKTSLRLSTSRLEHDVGLFFDESSDFSQPEVTTKNIVLKLEQELFDQDPTFVGLVRYLKDQSLALMKRSTDCVDLSIGFPVTTELVTHLASELTASGVEYCKVHYDLQLPSFDDTIRIHILPARQLSIHVRASKGADPRTKVKIQVGSPIPPFLEHLKVEIMDPNVVGSWTPDISDLCRYNYYKESKSEYGTSYVFQCGI